MSELLQSLLEEIGDPDRADLAQVAPLVHARMRALPKERQIQLRDEITEYRKGLTQGTALWHAHQVVYQFIWHVTRVPRPLTEEEAALQEQIKTRLANGGWTWEECLTPEEAFENSKKRMEGLLAESDLSCKFE